MSDRLLKLLLIDQDPIFRLGLRVALEEMPNLQVVAEVETDIAALQILAEAKQDSQQVNLVVLELVNGCSIDSHLQGLQLCRQLKVSYPTLPILLLSSVQDSGILSAAKAIGVDGYCPKGTSIAQLVNVMAEIATGRSHWLVEINLPRPPNPPSFDFPLFRLRHNLRLSGINYINDSLTKVTDQLQIPGLPILDRAVLAGQRRELLAARWLVNHLLSSSPERQQQQLTTSAQQLTIPTANSSIIITDNQQQLTSPPLINPRVLQSTLFTSCVTKLQFSLENITDVALEIDIFREDKKRELLYLILQKLAKQLDELRSIQITVEKLEGFKNTILFDLWQATVTDFFGRFSQVQVGQQNIEVVNVLLQNPRAIQIEILNKIPFVGELFSYLLMQTDLHIDNNLYLAGSDEAKTQALSILENLLIQVANGVVQPLLNYLADVETIKKDFYTRKLISTREIERFRNNLSWKYRLNNYVNEAKAIFESRYELFVLAPRGIAKISIYAPRNEELAKLSGIPLFVTLGLEFRDAIAPRLQSLVSFLGSGIVFVLTQIIGRGLGLIGRGILQGIGSVSLQDKNFKRNSERPK